MNNLWEVIKTAFSGIFNLGTLIGLLTAVFVYGVVCIITIYRENKEFAINLLAMAQFQLDMLRNKWAKIIARWLWAKIIYIDYKRRCQLVVHPTNDGDWHAAILYLSQVKDKSENVKNLIKDVMEVPFIPYEAKSVAEAVYNELVTVNMKWAPP
jgi:hypothetical protein